MKIFIKSIVFIFLLIGMGMTTAQAQNYDKAIGLRYTGWGSGISAKMFLNETAAVEAVVSYRSYGSFLNYSSSNVGVMGMYQLHKDLDWIDGLQWYYGGAASFNYYSVNYNSGGGTNYSNSTIGIGGVIGLEYKFESLPITISSDLIPIFGFGGFFKGLYFNGGGSIRYAF